jgi:hypothetical protein
MRNKLKARFHEPTVKVESARPIDCDLVFGSVVKFGGRGRFMRRHLLGMLEPARFCCVFETKILNSVYPLVLLSKSALKRTRSGCLRAF